MLPDRCTVRFVAWLALFYSGSCGFLLGNNIGVAQERLPQRSLSVIAPWRTTQCESGRRVHGISVRTGPLSVNHRDDDRYAPYPHVFVSPHSSSWIQEASTHLEVHGVCALLGDEAVISSSICDQANAAAGSRLKDMHQRIRNRGVDPTGVADGPYRFHEIVCRDEGGRWYDVPVAWMASPGASANGVGAPLQPQESDAVESMHKEVQRIAEPIVEALWHSDKHNTLNGKSSKVAAAGFLVNEPGSSSQKWHRDGPDKGYIDVFIPLIDLTEAVGPTALQPGTHAIPSKAAPPHAVSPLLRKGEILMFDYRTLHRGQSNRSSSTTRTLAYAVYTRQWGASYVGDIHNFPAALTLEYD